MQKPFSAEELTGKVSDLLRQGMAASASPRLNGAAGPIVAPAALPTPAVPALANGTHPVAAPTPSPTPTVAPTLDGCLAGLASAEGVHAVVLADRGGRLIGTAGSASDAATLGALTACLASASDEVGDELGRGDIQGLILEHGKGWSWSASWATRPC